jgi:hypothetical protein
MAGGGKGSKTTARAMGAKGEAGKQDRRAFIQKTLIRNNGNNVHGVPTPRDVTHWSAWTVANGDLSKQKRLTLMPTMAEAISRASNRGYEVINPDGSKRPLLKIRIDALTEQLTEVDARLAELTSAFELNDTLPESKQMSKEQKVRFEGEQKQLTNTKVKLEVDISKYTNAQE